MRLKKVILKNFRSYNGEIEVSIDKNLTAFIGKNDSGKSTVLEALAIFFEHGSVKPDSQDKCVYSKDDSFSITCIFTEIPKKILIDASAPTSLADEYLLNNDNELEICKLYKGKSATLKAKVSAVSKHPTKKGISNLLNKKITDLRELAIKLKIDTTDVNLSICAEIRKAIWNSFSNTDLELKNVKIPLDKEDGKKIWEQLEKQLPYFALFKSDRPSTDQDEECQDPMKVAVSQALKELEPELEKIKNSIQKKTEEVAKRTIEKLNDFDPSLAKQLSPNFKSDPKWSTIFKLALTGDDDIPITKRGSGVRRLILLSFFRAEVEKKKSEEKRGSMIYAIEEPENSQHPDNQIALIETIHDLSESDDCQIVVTTHVPALAGLLPTKSLRHVTKEEDESRNISIGTDQIFKTIANDLGILPDKRVQLMICVEGPNDVRFLKHLSKIMRENNPSNPDLINDNRILLFPLGGSTLKDWVHEQYLRVLGLPEIHIYDTDDLENPTYQKQFEIVNKRPNSQAFQTEKKNFENYFHKDAITQGLGSNLKIELDDLTHVGKEVAIKVHEVAPDSKDWNSISSDTKKTKIKRAKQRIYKDCLPHLDIRMLRERNSVEELQKWMDSIKSKLK